MDVNKIHTYKFFFKAVRLRTILMRSSKFEWLIIAGSKRR